MLRTSFIVLTALQFLVAAPTVTRLAAEEGNAILMLDVYPAAALPGTIVTVTGARLDAAHVRGVYLTDGNTDYRAEIIDQRDAALRFRVPAKAPAGRLRVAVEEASTGMILDEPVFVRVLPIPPPTGI